MNISFLTTSYFKGDESNKGCEFSEESHAIYIYVGGHATIRFNGNTYEPRKGNVIVIPARTTRYECSDPDNHAEIISFRFIWDDMPEGLLWMVKDSDGRMTKLAQWLYASWSQYSEYMGEIRNGLLTGLLAEFLRLSDQQQQEKMMVAKIRAYTQDNISQKITLDKLTELSGLEKSYFNRCYKAEAGVTPMEDVRRIRIQKAVDLWRSGNMSLSDIAKEVCVPDVSTLSHLFKKYTGYSPRNLPNHEINLLNIKNKAS